jgi:outer membrane murein-binding lipoprotein Lpp
MTSRTRRGSVTRGVTSIVGAVAWLALSAALALGGAGLVGELTHPPGGANREELTYPGDTLLKARLDDASNRLRQIAADVDQLSSDAKSALEDLASSDPTALQKALDHGSSSAVILTGATADLRNGLAGLPGDEPDAVMRFSNATLVRRAGILAALDAAGGLADQWQQITGRSVDAGRLTTLLQDHDKTVAAAIALGLDKCLCKFADAVTVLTNAKATLAEITLLKSSFSSGSEVTVLDAWLSSHTRYDAALNALYAALAKSDGKTNLTVQAAFREEKIARGLLPSDNRSLIVIVAEFARGGLNQAVLAIEDASGRIDAALAEASPV